MSLLELYPSLVFLIHIQRWIMIQYRQAFTRKTNGCHILPGIASLADDSGSLFGQRFIRDVCPLYFFIPYNFYIQRLPELSFFRKSMNILCAGRKSK